MRDIPGIFWILILTFVAGGTLFFYSSLGPGSVPHAESAWQHVEEFRQNLEYRRVGMAVGATQESVAPPYRIIALRLADSEVPTHVARYILRVRSLDTGLKMNRWLKDGLDVDLIDLKPGNVLGSVRLVAARRLSDTP
ncbi:MAG: hypothetical protein V1798_12455 [Pseudomonadota bacterium]